MIISQTFFSTAVLFEISIPMNNRYIYQLLSSFYKINRRRIRLCAAESHKMCQKTIIRQGIVMIITKSSNYLKTSLEYIVIWYKGLLETFFDLYISYMSGQVIFSRSLRFIVNYFCSVFASSSFIKFKRRLTTIGFDIRNVW